MFHSLISCWAPVSSPLKLERSISQTPKPVHDVPPEYAVSRISLSLSLFLLFCLPVCTAMRPKKSGLWLCLESRAPITVLKPRCRMRIPHENPCWHVTCFLIVILDMFFLVRLLRPPPAPSTLPWRIQNA